MAVLCTNVNKDKKNKSNAHPHVGALMNPHLYSHTLISNSDKAPPPNTHMHSAQPFSRDWLPSPQRDRHVPPKNACICKRGRLSVVYSVFVNKIPEAIVAVRWLALVDTAKEVLFRCICFTHVSKLFLWPKFQEYEEFHHCHGCASSTFPNCFSLSSYANLPPPPRLHFSVNIKLVPRALEDLRCFHPICYIKWQIFAFALRAVSQPIGIKST